jgi:hemerythrin
MALIDWDKSLSVNVEEIDKQHKKLIAMINELNDAMRNGKGKEGLGAIIDSPNAYTVTHFKTEDGYFTRFAYPQTASHRKEHAYFVQKYSDIKNDFSKGKLALSIEVMEFLGKWLKDHIMVTDKNYSGFFNEKGLK